MTKTKTPLSLRHERFVAEYLKDYNATRAYLRAGYAPRGAQANASKLLHRPHIQAAVTSGKQRITQSLEITVERMAAEYARIAFANVDDFIAVDDDGRVRIDLSNADRAQRAGLLELSVTDGGEGQPQRVKIKLGKLQALDSLARHLGVLVDRPAPGMTSEDRARYEQEMAAYRRSWNHSLEEQRRMECELRETRAALDAVKSKLAAAGVAFSSPAAVPEDEPPALSAPRAASREQAPVIELPQLRLPGGPEMPPARYVPGAPASPNIAWPGQNLCREPSSADALRHFFGKKQEGPPRGTALPLSRPLLEAKTTDQSESPEQETTTIQALAERGRT